MRQHIAPFVTLYGIPSCSYCFMSYFPKLLLFFGILFCAGLGQAQQFYVCSDSGFSSSFTGFNIHKTDLSPGTGAVCRIAQLDTCLGHKPAAIAMINDTFYSVDGYYLKKSRIITVVNPNQSVSERVIDCAVVCQLPQLFKSLAVDGKGMLYAVKDYAVYKINPPTGITTLLGNTPFSSNGDLTFYRGHLYMAASLPSSGLVKVNLQNPSLSVMHIPIPYSNIRGLVTVPDSCGTNNGVYAIPRNDGVDLTIPILRLNMEQHTYTVLLCRFSPIKVTDAAANVEKGIFMDSISIKPECKNTSASGSIRFVPAPGAYNYTYTVNNSVTNTTGLFTGLAAGTYSIRISAEGGCSLDTFATVPLADTPFVQIQVTDGHCSNSGKIVAQASNATAPYFYSLNNGTPQLSGTFSNLGQGNYLVMVADSNSCNSTAYTNVNISYPQPLFPVISAVGALCNSANGSISVYASAAIGYSINNGGLQLSGQFTHLTAGNYAVRIYITSNCCKDTLVTVPRLLNPVPQLLITTIPACRNGSTGNISLIVNGNYPPYFTSLQNGVFTRQLSYTHLQSDTFLLQVKDADGCLMDTAVYVPEYTTPKPSYTIWKQNPTCLLPQSGTIQFNMIGSGFPYSVLYRNNTYTANHLFQHVPAGNHSFTFTNNQQCPVDTVGVSLQLTVLKECDTLYIPTAFTPNNDGRNDVFKAISYGILQNFHIAVYNRYGQMVFTSNDIRKGWDGKMNGKQQNTGTYVWLVSYQFATAPEKKQKGSVVMVR